VSAQTFSFTHIYFSLAVRQGERRVGKTVAIMQPYFAPYGGYWRLLAGSDLFVIYDCVQFPRRGWVHRNRLPDAKGEAQWLTLPLAPAPFDARIEDMVFASDATERMTDRVRAFPSLARLNPATDRLLHAAPLTGPFVDYAARQIEVACELLGVACRVIRSSALQIDPQLKAQDRILAILQAVGASDYLNAPGGRDLYQPDAFAAQGLGLHFLDDYVGPSWSLLHRLSSEPLDALRTDIVGQTPRPHRT